MCQIYKISFCLQSKTKFTILFHLIEQTKQKMVPISDDFTCFWLHIYLYLNIFTHIFL